MQYRDVILLDDSLYAELYQRYAPPLFAYAWQQTASREVAEDIVLDVFLSVLQNRRFQDFDEKKQEAWLWTITRNKVVDYYRRSTRRRHLSIDCMD
jgi:RNA polymerase sigma-70 factor, ECF subfamily